MARESKRDLIDQVVAEVRAFQSAADEMDETASERLGLNRTDHRCLDVLEREAPITAGRLAEASGLTTGAITTVLDRLERAGYARRARDAEDRRRVLVEVTPTARRRTGELYGPLVRAGDAVLARYSARELALLRDFMREARALTAQHAARLRTSAPRA